MVLYSLHVRISALIVQLPLHFFLILKVALMPVHESLIFVTPVLYLVREFRVLLSNFYLPLQALLLVVELAEAILEQLRLNKNKIDIP